MYRFMGHLLTGIFVINKQREVSEMKKYAFKTMGFVTLAMFLVISGGGGKASAATLTEKLRAFFNNDVPDFIKNDVPGFMKDVTKMKLDNFEVTPFRIIDVKGDAAKFRALNWMNDGTTTGIENMTFNGEAGEGDYLTFEGHAIPGDNDLGAVLRLTKSNGSYISMDYGNFSKWYDVYGGFYPGFTGTSSIKRLSADPKLDIGHFNFDIGTAAEGNPGIAFSFAHDSKEGIKSRLIWGNIVQTIARKISPSWQEVSTATDSVALKGTAEVGGFNINGQQSAEFYSGRTFREDNDGSTSSVTITNRSYEMEPQSKRLVSSLKADRWIIDDKTYMAFAYQFQHSRSDMNETIRDADSVTGALLDSGSHNRVVDAQASLDSHSWVQHFVTNLTSNLNFVTKFKEEIIAQTGSGFGDGYTSSSSDKLENTENEITRTGQSISLRYGGLPKTSLYTDWDFQQDHNWLSKLSVSTTSSYTEFIDRNSEITGVIGVRYVPNSKFNVTSQLRNKSGHDTYNIISNTDNGMILSRLEANTAEWNSRFTWKPMKWFQNSFRLQLGENVYHSQDLGNYTNSTEWLKSQALSRTYTYDIILQPLDEWMFDLAYSLNNAKVSTPASQVAPASGGIPVFLANVYTWMFTSSYTPKDNLSFFNSFQYSRAKNYNDLAFTGIPYGVDNERYDLTLGAKWSLKKDLTLEPKYGYYSYRANESIDYGNYSAHVFMLDAKFDW